MNNGGKLDIEFIDHISESKYDWIRVCYCLFTCFEFGNNKVQINLIVSNPMIQMSMLEG